MLLRRLWAGFTLVAAVLAQTSHYTPTITRAPSSTASAACSQQACATHTNECGVLYGGCFPVCAGNTVPVFTPPPCPASTSTSTTASPSTACPTVCWDMMNSCSMWYGGCTTMCSPYNMPTFTPPPCPATATSSASDTDAPVLFATAARQTQDGCSNMVCWDYQNDCGIRYGGCHHDCPGVTTPSYINPGCPSSSGSTRSFSTRTKSACGVYCPQYVDSCANTFGPGCYTSCPGAAPPAFTTPYCETSGSSILLLTTTADFGRNSNP